jgi:hypothetical protein
MICVHHFPPAICTAHGGYRVASRRQNRFVAGRSFAAVVLALVAFVTASVEKATSASGRVECGVERWTVKTLQDRPALLPGQQTTIAFLSSRPAPASLPETRLPSSGTSSP